MTATDETRTHLPSDWEARRAKGRAWAYAKPADDGGETIARCRALLGVPSIPAGWPVPIAQADLRALLDMANRNP